MTSPEQTRRSERREFMLDTAKMACGVGILGLGLGLYGKQARALPPGAIRPPGALKEDDFLGACVRCGLCVRDCLYYILSLARPGHEVATGTPFFVARNKPCEMCEDIPCVKACPTGALQVRENTTQWALGFDDSRCVGCGVCTEACRRLAQ